MIKRHHDGSIGSQFGSRLVETAADIGNRTCTVVGQAIDDDECAAGTKRLITRGLEVLAARAGGFLDRLVNHMARYIVSLGFLDETAQNRIGIRIGHPILGRHVQLFAVFGIEL